MLHPNGNLVNIRTNWEHRACYFIRRLKLLANQTQKKVFPNLVGKSLWKVKSDGAASLMFWHLPNGLHPFNEHVKGGSFGHFRRAFQVLVHGPKFVDWVKVGECLDILRVPPLLSVLCIQCVPVFELNRLRTHFLSLRLVSCHGSNCWIFKFDHFLLFCPL